MFGLNSRNPWLWVAVSLTALKLWLVAGQTVSAIGVAIHDDRLFAVLAEHILNGDWLGPYDQYTLAKGPLYPLFIAGNFWIGLPLILSQQILYAIACLVLTLSLGPWLKRADLKCGFYLILLWNPISFDAGNLSRLMRQNIYTPLAMLTLAGLILYYARRHESLRRQIPPALLGGLSLGCFWLTREESVWLLPAVILLVLGFIVALGHELKQRWRVLMVSSGIAITAAILPSLIVSTINWQHYGWFGTVEFKASEFKAAYGALIRPKVGPVLDQVPVSRQMRETIYEISPTFAELKPYLEGPVGDHWSDKISYAAEGRQIKGGWFVWALRDAVAKSGHAPDAGSAMRFYQRIADEVNAACDDGRLPARSPRSGFAPPLDTIQLYPLFTNTLEFTRYFITFSGFTAHSPDSRGDYADLKPFRNLVGTPLSFAPRSPEPVTEQQNRLRQWKVNTLEALGLFVGRILSWLGPLILIVGLARALECIADRRLSYLLGLAGALLSACGAYLAINILIQVTSFYNQSPAALAAAYPLYLTALAGILLDARNAWRSPSPVRPNPEKGKAYSSLLPKLIVGGTAVVIFAARLGEIHAFASNVPLYDQWLVEGMQIVRPWLDGTLSLGNFFIPHAEHIPLWNRVFMWLQILITGKWDPLVQMTANALLFTGFAILIARWVLRYLTLIAALPIIGILILCGSIPHAWENITWGYQSATPLALIFILVHLHGSCTQQPWSRHWWFAQGAAAAALFTLEGMWLTPLVVSATFLWSGPLKIRKQLVPLSIGVIGLMLSRILNKAPASSSLFQDPITYLHNWLHLLGWPSAIPGSVGILLLPWLIHALRLRNKSEISSFDRIILSLGLWNISYALIIAAKLPSAGEGFVSQYGDLHLLGLLASAMALTRLIPNSARMRPALLSLSVVWCGLVVGGLITNTFEGQSRHFHSSAASQAEIRRHAIQSVLQDHNRSPLESPSARGLLYHDTDALADLIESPKFSNVFPSSVFPENTPGLIESSVRTLQCQWGWLLSSGLILTLIGMVLSSRHAPSPETIGPLPYSRDPWRWRISAIIGCLALLLLSAWSNPFAFNQEKRWQQTIGGETALKNLSFSVHGAPTFNSNRLQGAAPITPIVLRNKFFGTAPDGTGFTGTVYSSVFKITSHWLVVPYAGYPIGDGNGLRIRILDQAGEATHTEIGCLGPNRTDIGYWQVDLSNYQGRKARLVLYDGRTETEAWVAAAPPVPTDDPSLDQQLQRRLKNEGHAGFHSILGMIAFIATLCATISWWGQRKSYS